MTATDLKLYFTINLFEGGIRLQRDYLPTFKIGFVAIGYEPT